MRTIPASTYCLPVFHKRKSVHSNDFFFYFPNPLNKFWNIKWLFTDWNKIYWPFQIWSNISTLEKHFLRRVTNGDTVPQFHTLCPVGGHQLARNVSLQPHHLSLRPSHLSEYNLFEYNSFSWCKKTALLPKIPSFCRYESRVFVCWGIIIWGAEHECSWKYNKQKRFKITLIKKNKLYVPVVSTIVKHPFRAIKTCILHLCSSESVQVCKYKAQIGLWDERISSFLLAVNCSVPPQNTGFGNIW